MVWSPLFVLLLIISTSVTTLSSSPRSTVVSLLQVGDAIGALKVLETQSRLEGGLDDGDSPSLYYYAGIASQLLGDLEASVAGFTKALQHDRYDVQTWLNLGDVFLYQYDGEKALASFEEAFYLSGGHDKAPSHILAKVHRAQSWMLSWHNIEVLTLELQLRLQAWYEHHIKDGSIISTITNNQEILFWNQSYLLTNRHKMHIVPVMPADFGDLPLSILKLITPLQPQADPTPPPGISPYKHDDDDQLWNRFHYSQNKVTHSHKLDKMKRDQPLHVGFVSSDFGVHPVSSLVRGFLQQLNQAKHHNHHEDQDDDKKKNHRNKKKKEKGDISALVVSCWVLTDDDSWWRRNISHELGHHTKFVNLHGLSHENAAKKIKASKVDVLVDLNGHTRGSGLLLLRLKPARVQISWLGYPATTGAEFIDYYLCDIIACDPLVSHIEFTEKMLYIPSSYIVNDHANMLSHSSDITSSSYRSILKKKHLSKNDIIKERIERREISGFQDILRNEYIELEHRNELDDNADGDDEQEKKRTIEDHHIDMWLDKDGSFPTSRTGPLLASFSNFMKMNPQAIEIWCSVLVRSPSASLWIQAAELADLALPNLRLELAARGVWPGRMVTTRQQPWIHHVTTKTAADLILDTPLKNQHSTSLDALWAGVPLITLAGDRSPRRAGASLLSGLGGGGELGQVYSLKEYEDLATLLANDENLLHFLRREVAKSRTDCNGLFDSRAKASDFFSLIHAAVEANFDLEGDDPQSSVWLGGHSLTTTIDKEWNKDCEIPTFSALEEALNTPTPPYEDATATSTDDDGDDDSSVPNYYRNADGAPLLLNIGGRTARPGWTIVNVMESKDAAAVDVVGHMADLYMFQDASVTAVYASHVLEHASYKLPAKIKLHSKLNKYTREEQKAIQEERHVKLGMFSQGEIAAALSEFHRVLLPGGALFVAVPDMDVLAALYLNNTLSSADKFFVMRMIFGGQVDEHDFHFTGFDEDLMTQLLTATGFCEVRRVPSFNLFQDTSVKLFKGVPISLNIAATACKPTLDGRPMSDENRIYVSIPAANGDS